MSGKDFLSRWSDRKRAAADQDGSDASDDLSPQDPPAEPATDQPPPDDRTDAEILADMGLKDPDQMTQQDDFSAFMSAAVPARLRTRALRRLWHVNPAFAHIDAMVEYGEDYTNAATVVENLQTAYEVGKGMLRDAIEQDDPAITEDPGEPEEVTAADAPPPQDIEPRSADPQDVQDVQDAQDAQDAQALSDALDPRTTADIEPEDSETARRAPRMAFRFPQA